MENYKEEFKVKGEELIGKIKELIHEGNVRRIIIKDEAGKTFIEIPITIGIIGALVAPILAAVGAIAVMAAKFTVEVVRSEEPEKKK
ncbi:MAG: DUF4342 domain-containing protein [Bacteroidales bacterium]|nr:DUF4342 domain-containing protein [Bacteroidales bacterium]